MTDLGKRRARMGVGQWALAVLPVALGLALRLAYALHAEPFVDEPTTLLVAQAIARSGRPILPSGLFYGNDLPYAYVAGGLVALFGPQLLALRLFSVAVSLATVVLAFHAGRRLFSFRVGLWAALALALTAQEIVWGGRARAYALLGLLVLAAVWLILKSVLQEGEEGRPRAGGRVPGGLWKSARQGSGPAAAGSGSRRLGLALLVLAIFVHPEAVLLVPAVVLGAALVRGWRWWLRADPLAELALVSAAAAGRYWLQMALARGRLSGLETLAGSRPPLQPGVDLWQRLGGIGPFFVEPGRLAWTGLALLALGLAAWSLWGRARRAEPAGDRPAGDEPAGDRAVLFLSACLWLPPLLMVVFLGSTYQSPRYLALLLPVFALLAAAGLDRLLGRAVAWIEQGGWKAGLGHRRERSAVPGSSGPSTVALPRAIAGNTSTLLAAVITIALLPGYVPAALAAATSPEKGFRTAFELVRAGWQPGDRVASVAPAYSLMVLGRSDLFALGQEYEEFVYRAPDGRWVDRWAGAPLIRSAGDLAAALDAGGRLWLVADEGRLRQRFDPAFAQLAWQRMELVARTGDVLVFHSVSGPPPAASHPVDAVWQGQVALTGYELGRAPAAGEAADTAWGEVLARPGECLPLTLHWQATGPVTADYTAFVHLVGADGRRYAQDDGPPLKGMQPTGRWLAGETLFDRRGLDLPGDLPPGRYRLEVGLYAAADDRLSLTGADGEPRGDTLLLDYVRVPADGEQPPVPAQPLEVELAGEGDRVRLLGYELLPGGTDSLRLVLYWQAAAPLGADYTAFVHLLDAAGTIRGQGDGPPVGGFYPTSAWDTGEVVADEHGVSLEAGLAPGRYRLVVGLYHLPSGRRLMAGGEDEVELAAVEWGR